MLSFALLVSQIVFGEQISGSSPEPVSPGILSNFISHRLLACSQIAGVYYQPLVVGRYGDGMLSLKSLIVTAIASLTASIWNIQFPFLCHLGLEVHA